MDTTVYIWGRLNLSGHVSIAFGDHYASFHPVTPDLVEDLLGSPAMLKGNRAFDTRGGDSPTNTIHINWLNVDAMHTRACAIANACDTGRLKYRLFGTNCSSVVADLLAAGVGQEFAPHKTMSQLWDELKRR